MKTDHIKFLRDWASNPTRVGAIAPSGRALARLMTSEISSATGPVLELGPGTGVFTKALLKRGVAAHDLTLVEYSPDFARLLESRFPGVRVVCMNAARMPQSLLFSGAPLGAIVSGLPLLSMSPRTIFMTLSGSFQFLRPGASFFQFTYGPRCPVPRPILERLGLKARFIGRTLQNMPPAAVYGISRRQSDDDAGRH